MQLLLLCFQYYDAHLVVLRPRLKVSTGTSTSSTFFWSSLSPDGISDIVPAAHYFGTVEIRKLCYNCGDVAAKSMYAKFSDCSRRNVWPHDRHQAHPDIGRFVCVLVLLSVARSGSSIDSRKLPQNGL